MEATKLSYMSDNQLRMTIRTADGDIVSPADTWFKIYLQCGGKIFTAVNDPNGDEGQFCHVENDVLVIDIPGRKLGIGVIEYMIEVRENSTFFADGYKNTFPLSYTQTNIELV
jgi:hypothetical protein